MKLCELNILCRFCVLQLYFSCIISVFYALRLFSSCDVYSLLMIRVIFISSVCLSLNRTYFPGGNFLHDSASVVHLKTKIEPNFRKIELPPYWNCRFGLVVKLINCNKFGKVLCEQVSQWNSYEKILVVSYKDPSILGY